MYRNTLVKITTAGVAGLLLSGCIQNPGELIAEQETSITVGGEGVVKVLPDQATVALGVQLKNPELKPAQAAVAVTIEKLLKLTDSLDIDRNDVRTVSANVRPEYRWNKERDEQALIGYSAERSVVVQLDNLDDLGKLIEGAVEVGMNKVSPPVLSSTKARDAYREALELAAIDARKNAETIAAALDTEIDDVLSVNATSSFPPPRPMMRSEAMLASDAGAASTYTSGEIEYRATVTASFEIEDD